MTLDLIIKGGTIFDGSGSEPFSGDIGIVGDQIVAVGPVDDNALAHKTIEASGLAVAPGFINMLSHSYFSILHDPRSLGELKQGVTTQIMGEGESMGPLTDSMKDHLVTLTGALDIACSWTRLSEYLSHVEKRGCSQNVASFIGAATLRINAVGYENRPATKAELDKMKSLADEEMAEGALGIGTALIYPPGNFAPTEELIELCKVAARYRGKYISHLRSEGNEFLEGLAELLKISRTAEIPAHVWHLKAAGKRNWDKMDQAIHIIEEARAAGEPITADLYPYIAGGTALASAIPPRFHEGGSEKLLERLGDPDQRAQIRKAIEESDDGWENLYKGVAGPEGILILGAPTPELKSIEGSTLADVAASRGTDPIEVLMDLVVEGSARIFAAYFMMSEGNLVKQMQLPWVSFCSDAPSMSPEGRFLESSTHPRSYGTFARILGKYVREEKVVSLPEAIRRLTSLPADTLELDRRGRLGEGYFADLVIFDPATIADKATFESPHQFAVGVRDVIVNGKPALKGGEFTGDFGGRALFGPGKR